MLFNEQCCSLLFQQYRSALMKQQRLFTVVETGESNIDRTCLFTIVIIVTQPSNTVTTLFSSMNK